MNDLTQETMLDTTLQKNMPMITVRCPSVLYKAIKDAAMVRGMSINSFCVDSLCGSASDILRESDGDNLETIEVGNSNTVS